MRVSVAPKDCTPQWLASRYTHSAFAAPDRARRSVATGGRKVLAGAEQRQNTQHLAFGAGVASVADGAVVRSAVVRAMRGRRASPAASCRNRDELPCRPSCVRRAEGSRNSRCAARRSGTSNHMSNTARRVAGCRTLTVGIGSSFRPQTPQWPVELATCGGCSDRQCSPLGQTRR